MNHSPIVLVAALALSAGVPSLAQAQEGADQSKIRKVNASSLNVRKGPSTRYASVGRLARNTRVSVHRFQAGWAQITYRGARRWTSARYLVRITTSTPARPTAPTPSRPTPTTPGTKVAVATYEITYSRLNIRSGPSTRNAIVVTYSRGAKVRVIRRSGSWNGFSRGGRIVWAYAPGMRRVTATPPARPTPSKRPVQVGAPVRRPYPRLKVKVSTAALRTHPRSLATRIRTLTRYQILTVVRTSGAYRGVKASSAASSPFIGWVHSSLLTTLGSGSTPVRPQTRSGTKTKSIGGSKLGVSISRTCTVSHDRAKSSGSESWTLTGKFLDRRYTVASGQIRVGATAGGRPTVTTKKISYLSRTFTLTPEKLNKSFLWIDGEKNRPLYAGFIGPIPVTFRVDVGLKMGASFSRGRNTVGVTGSEALFGEGQLELDGGIVRGGVRATLDLIEVSLPATLTFNRNEVKATVDYVVASKVSVGLYVIVGRKVFGVGYEKEFTVDLPFLQFTLAEVRIPILSASVSGS